MSETILVTGVGGPAGRAGASYFASKGYRVVGTDMREVPSPASDFRIVPAARDERFVSVLLAIATREKASLVVSTVTEELPVVARMRSALRERGIALSISDPPGVDVANDKLRTAEELDRAGVPVPPRSRATPRTTTSPKRSGFRSSRSHGSGEGGAASSSIAAPTTSRAPARRKSSGRSSSPGKSTT